MKTAAKFRFAALAIILGVWGAAPGAQAQLAAEPGPITSSVPGPSSPSQPAAPAAIQVSEPAVDAPKPVVAVKAGKDTAPAMVSAPGGVPDSVRGVIDRLNTATKDVTLEDLNEAREAVVKLDVLIDIEKRLNDLTKLRNERQAKMTGAVAAISGALPASALGAPVSSVPAPSMNASDLLSGPFSTDVLLPPSFKKDGGEVSDVSEAPRSSTTLEVSRILGAAGSYVAVIKERGKTKRVREGDKLADGGRVTSISRDGLTFSRNGKTETLQVKDVSRVFSSR